ASPTRPQARRASAGPFSPIGSPSYRHARGVSIRSRAPQRDPSAVAFARRYPCDDRSDRDANRRGDPEGRSRRAQWDARVKPNEIGVAVEDGIVTLTGGVDSYVKKWAAEEAAHRIKGVQAVANDIEVRLPTSVERTDKDVAAAVTRAL